jgi:hypothetical protein
MMIEWDMILLVLWIRIVRRGFIELSARRSANPNVGVVHNGDLFGKGNGSMTLEGRHLEGIQGRGCLDQ